MAFISKQWLVGSPERRRNHGPIEANLRIESSDDAWCRRKGVVATFSVVRSDGDYMELLFEQPDTNVLFVSLAEAASDRARLKQAIETLRTVDDRALLCAFSKILSLRSLDAAAHEAKAEASATESV